MPHLYLSIFNSSEIYTSTMIDEEKNTINDELYVNRQFLLQNALFSTLKP